jgi:hypothetical protein
MWQKVGEDSRMAAWHTFLEWMLFSRTGGQTREAVGITTEYAPPDVAAYRRYLPERLQMPAEPCVKLVLIDYLEVSPRPFARYQEWSVLLRAASDGGEGWFPVTMPVTTWTARQGGHHLGFPKYVADSIVLVDDGVVAAGRASARNQLDMSMRFTLGGLPPRPDGHARRQLVQEGLFDAPFLLLKPVGIGPEVCWVGFDEVVASVWTTRQGMVAVTGDAGGLVPGGASLPGLMCHFRGGMNLVRRPRGASPRGVAA